MGEPLRVIVFHGPDNVSKNELLAWLRGSDVGADARTVGEMVPHSKGTVDDRVDEAIRWANKLVAIVAPDARTPSGAPNVIDEIGRTRGAGRSSDLAILRHRDCADMWSNLHGVVRIEYDARVSEGYIKILRFLGLLGKAGASPNKGSNISIPMPKIRREFSDVQRADFLRASYASLVEYFREALARLEKENPDVETRLDIQDRAVVVEVYVGGARRSYARIWIGTPFHSGQQILYSESASEFGSGNALNDYIDVEVHDGELQLKASNMWMAGPDVDTGPFGPLGAAQYLWLRLTNKLRF